jgi:DNA-binding transcriptional regulator YiaG
MTVCPSQNRVLSDLALDAETDIAMIIPDLSVKKPAEIMALCGAMTGPQKSRIDGIIAGIDKQRDVLGDQRPMTLHLTGPEVARARRSYGMTGFDLARRAGISVDWLFAVENGREATERLDKLNKALLDYVLSRRSS